MAQVSNTCAIFVIYIYSICAIYPVRIKFAPEREKIRIKMRSNIRQQFGRKVKGWWELFFRLGCRKKGQRDPFNKRFCALHWLNDWIYISTDISNCRPSHAESDRIYPSIFVSFHFLWFPGSIALVSYIAGYSLLAGNTRLQIL